MASAYIHEVVAELGAYPFLQRLERECSSRGPLDPSYVRTDLFELDEENPDYLMEQLFAAGLLTWRGDRIALSDLGSRTALLLEALNSGNIRSVFERLAEYDSTLRMYELVREGMTEGFLDSLTKRPGFKRLYICSPWVSLTQRNKDALMSAFLREERRGVDPELLVITRPRQGTTSAPPEDVEALRELGATIFLHPSLHTKLYIREPGPRGGDITAVVGSQNLTQSKYLELGIRINSDTRLVNQLIAYFFDLTNTSTEA